ncbi:transposable element Tc1 transposase [Trichonephila clavipes]|nr:transposable element Tc1 transposase [Trichonephila clavipes]
MDFGEIDVEKDGYVDVKRHRESFEKISKFDRGRIAAYSDCGLSFREIGQRVGRNQATVMRISHRGCRRNRRGRSLLPCFTTDRDDTRIEPIEVLERAAVSRNMVQPIQYVTHHSVSARTIRRLCSRVECSHCFVCP